MIIETSRLILREWKMSDIPFLVENMNDIEMSRDFGTNFPYTYDDAKNFIEDAIKNNKKKFAIILKESNNSIGGCGLHLSGKIGSGSLWIAKKYRRMGYGTEAVRAIFQYGFEHCNVERYENYYYKGNLASKRLQLRIGSVDDNANCNMNTENKTHIRLKMKLLKKDFI